MEVRCTFGDGILYLSALSDDVLVVDAFLLLNEVVTEAVLLGVRRRGGRVAVGRDLHARDQVPLREREQDPHHGTNGDHNLRGKIREQHRHPRRNPRCPYAGEFKQKI